MATIDWLIVLGFVVYATFAGLRARSGSQWNLHRPDIWCLFDFENHIPALFWPPFGSKGPQTVHHFRPVRLCLNIHGIHFL